MTDLLHRFAVPLIVAGDHGPLRRALARVGAHATAADPWLSLASALANVEAGELSAAQGDLRHARRCWPAHAAVGLTVLRAAADQLGAVPAGAAPAIPEEDLPVEPELEALARLSRGMALLECDDRGAARTATVFPAPTSPVITPRARSVTHQPIRATASPWLVWRCSICGARSRRNGERLNP